MQGLKRYMGSKYTKWFVGALAAAGVLGVGYQYYFTVSDLKRNTADLEASLTELQEKNITLQNSLYAEQQKNSAFESQIGDIASTVGRLDKLSKTDEELLQKYSKVYFLNENYVPEDLNKIPEEYVYNKNRTESMHTKALPFFVQMVEAAKNDGVDFKIISAYRSFTEQKSLKSNYTFIYGSGANKFSADQGYSEHQLGTTLDFTTAKLGAAFTNFKTSDGYTWLTQNAYKYGFILSYPEGNSYYQFEPWHWRFVGKSLAMYLEEENKNFYDLDQRKIDNYLINIFD